MELAVKQKPGHVFKPLRYFLRPLWRGFSDGRGLLILNHQPSISQEASAHGNIYGSYTVVILGFVGIW